MGIRRIDLLAHADFHGQFREDEDLPGLSRFYDAIRQVRSENPEGTLLLRLVGAGIAVYSPHTAHDSALFGINRQLAEGLGLTEVRSLYEGTVPATPTAAPTTPATVPAETKPEQPSKIRKTTKTPKQPEPAKPAIVVAKPEPKAAPAAKPAAPAKPAPAPVAGETISIRPAAKMVVPAGYDTDRVDVRTTSGAIVPLRTLLPNGMAAN